MLQTKQARDESNKQNISVHTSKLYICIQITNYGVQSEYSGDGPTINAQIPILYIRTLSLFYMGEGKIAPLVFLLKYLKARFFSARVV